MDINIINILLNNKSAWVTEWPFDVQKKINLWKELYNNVATGKSTSDIFPQVQMWAKTKCTFF